MNWYLVVAAAGAVVGMLLQPLLARAESLFTALDAVIMGLFGAVAASKALSMGVGEAGALVVGVIERARIPGTTLHPRRLDDPCGARPSAGW